MATCCAGDKQRRVNRSISCTFGGGAGAFVTSSPSSALSPSAGGGWASCGSWGAPVNSGTRPAGDSAASSVPSLRPYTICKSLKPLFSKAAAAAI
eukprot:CAMPEP_0179466326 /NCGR_PEP_ID=MMETSP0799-20121207/47654_1 /TAXON_ID=46947 /ORGANISM="Geminigera cryophila, Strain CCMP2564" /LENGTH=94 /DNA_ID=CAMNT_0021271021 /DNA_START=91 /DNA_END=375 /DNA_ORIENTATION=-